MQGEHGTGLDRQPFAPYQRFIEIGIYYHLHPEQFVKPEMREAWHILISINPDYPENTRETARTRLEEISAKLQKKPHKFADLALKHSECPTAFARRCARSGAARQIVSRTRCRVVQTESRSHQRYCRIGNRFSPGFVQADTKSGNTVLTKKPHRKFASL